MGSAEIGLVLQRCPELKARDPGLCELVIRCELPSERGCKVVGNSWQGTQKCQQ